MPPSRLRDRVSFAVTAAATLACVAALGCHASGPHGAGGGGAGQGGSGGTPDAAAPDGARLDGAPLDAPDPCPLAPTPLRYGTKLTLSLTPVLAGKPFVFGEPNALPSSGGTVMPLNFRFYVSHVALLRAGGAAVPVDLVTAAGAVEPYGVHLFNAEDPASQVLRVLAPPGTYTGLTFMLGLDDGCNSTSRVRAAPLDESSQMVWTHLAGYLFLRLEEQLGNGDAGAPDAGDAGAGDAAVASVPTAIHMGGVPGRLFAPTVTAPGALALVAGASSNRTLSIDMDQLYGGAKADGDPASLSMVLPFVEVQAGERLREHAPALPLFVLAP